MGGVGVGRRAARSIFAALGVALALLCQVVWADRAPSAVVASGDTRELYVAESAAGDVAVVNVEQGTVARRIEVPDGTGELALSPDGKTLYATNAAPAGRVSIVDVAGGQVTASIEVGHTPVAPVLSADGTRLYVCNRFTNDVSVVDTAARVEVARIAVVREPVAAALAPDGRFLFVANLLPEGPSDGEFIAAAVSVIDTAAQRVAATVTLPNGSSGLRGICVSPDGQYAYVTHILAHYQMPTTQVERGWMNTNALSVISVERKARVNTVLLDDVLLGAANPWAVACTADGRHLCLTHAGTHELSVIDRAGLHEKLDKVAAGERVSEVSAAPADVPNDLSFLVGLRRRVKLSGNGPRALMLAGGAAYVAEYFSDSLSIVRLEGDPQVRALALTDGAPPNAARRGQMLFNDARLCFQQWQSCASCHPDARTDGLNWDLLNDGMGNPRNTRSMLLSHQTPPVMSLGVRDSAEKAVRAGIRYIQFTVRPEEDAAAIDVYLRSLIPVPSPQRINGELSEDARKGEEIFVRAECGSCHPQGLYTDLKQYDVNTAKGADRRKPVDTPTLVEVWRTAPYLHDGRAATLEEVLTKHNPGDRHGKTSALSPEEIRQLAAFVRSL